MADNKRDDEYLNIPKRPTLHPPQSDPKAKKITLWIVLGVAAIAIVYVLLYSDLFKKKETDSQVVIPESYPSAPDTLTQAPPDTSMQDTNMVEEHSMPVSEEPQPVKKTEEKTAEIVKEKPAETKQAGSYTIYIGSFKNKSLAEKEKARLTGMDYDAFIVPKAGMFRVAIGKFATRTEAKTLAAEIKSTLKKECWIDRME